MAVPSLQLVEPPTVIELPIEAVRYLKEFYPRLRPDDAAIERYRAAIDLLPPIIVARGGVVVDGYHRWQAHKRERRATIRAIDLGNLTDLEIKKEACLRNREHGLQLSTPDKRRMVDEFYRLGVKEDAELARLLGITEKTAEEYARDARRDEKAALRARAWDLYLDCLSDRAIARALGITDMTANAYYSEFSNELDFSERPASWPDFDIWQFGEAGEGGMESFFGRMPPQVVESLLWDYTEPGWIIFDPFAGGGTTIDVAKRMGRRVWASDLTPSTPALPIHAHDILSGWPKEAPARVDFILLDPPYWKQAKGRYSESAQDLGNQSLDEFYASWRQVVKTCRRHLFAHGFLAFIISPSVDGLAVVDHARPMANACEAAGLIDHRRFIVPYQTQQATGQQVTWARENRQHLKLYRDLCIFRRA